MKRTSARFCVIIITAIPCVQVTELPFFATKVRIGREGIEEIFPVGPLNHHER